MSIKTISSHEVYRNKWSRFREDIIERENGERGVYGVLEKDPACIIIPLERTAEGDFLWLVEQYRYTVGKRYKEFPQGGWEMAEVDTEELARGELREETGLTSGKLTKLGMLWIAYGAMKQEHHVYLAGDLVQGDFLDRDEEEHDLEVYRVSVSEFEEMVLAGEIQDNCTLAAWGLYKVWQDRQSEK